MNNLNCVAPADSVMSNHGCIVFDRPAGHQALAELLRPEPLPNGAEPEERMIICGLSWERYLSLDRVRVTTGPVRASAWRMAVESSAQWSFWSLAESASASSICSSKSWHTRHKLNQETSRAMNGCLRDLTSASRTSANRPAVRPRSWTQ